MEARAEGGVQVERVPTRRDISLATGFLAAGAVLLSAGTGPVRSGGLAAAGYGSAALLGFGGFLVFAGAVLLVWVFGMALFPSRWLIRRDQLDVLKGFLRPKAVASFGAGPIEVVREIVTDRGRKYPSLEVRVPTPFIGEPFVLYRTNRDADAVWVARLLAQETGWQLFVTRDAGRPDLR
ncbi:MAG: hypothetical protein ACHQM4_06225 [Thermoanaerobaculia bacterium]